MTYYLFSLQYDRLEDLLVDVNQMVTNACQFNEEGSQVYTVRKGRRGVGGLFCEEREGGVGGSLSVRQFSGLC